MGEQLLARVPRMAPAQFSVALKSSGRAAGESLWHPLQPWRRGAGKKWVFLPPPSLSWVERSVETSRLPTQVLEWARKEQKQLRWVTAYWCSVPTGLLSVPSGVQCQCPPVPSLTFFTYYSCNDRVSSACVFYIYNVGTWHFSTKNNFRNNIEI